MSLISNPVSKICLLDTNPLQSIISRLLRPPCDFEYIAFNATGEISYGEFWKFETDESQDGLLKLILSTLLMPCAEE
jgi:hypothetical protein